MSKEKSSNEDEAGALIFSDALLPDELLEKILSVLPVASILNTTLVSKRWQAVVQRPWSVVPPPLEAWLFVPTTDMNTTTRGCVYNPNLRRWFTFVFPFSDRRWYSVATSGGLVTFLHNIEQYSQFEHKYSQFEVFVFNPITKEQLVLRRWPRLCFMFREIAMSVDRQTKSYTVAIVNCMHTHPVLSIHVYESKTGEWLVVLKQLVAQIYTTPKIVMCNGVLYCLYYSDKYYLLRLWDQTERTQPKSLIPIEVAMPSIVRSASLMNLREKLVMMGWLERKSGGIKDIIIWVLAEEGWKEVTRMPQEVIQERYGDHKLYSFYCCGTGDMVFVLCIFSPLMMIFDMVQMQWQWSSLPRSVALPFCYDVFCFEPNLKIHC